MNIRHRIIACAAFLLPLTGATEPPPPAVYKSAGPWAMEYADNGCRLIREFSDGKATLTVALERFSLEPTLRLGLTGTTVRSRRSEQEAEFRFTGQEELRTSLVSTSVLADGREAYLLSAASLIPTELPEHLRKINVTVPKSELPEKLKTELQIARQVTGITLLKGFTQPMSIELGPMTQPMMAMQACVEDLVKSWGLDPARIYAESRSVGPANNQGTWITPDDYPPGQLSRGNGGLVRVRLLIGADGAIGKCMIDVQKMGEFEETVCRNLAKRARFVPALDSGGQPTASYWAGTWQFRMR